MRSVLVVALRPRVVLALALSAGLTYPTIATAQERKGFWVSFLAGPSSAGLRCDDCAAGREAGFSVILSAGGTWSPRLLIGGELGIWFKESVDPVLDAILTVDLYTYTGTVTFYPKASSRFFVKGGVGFSAVDQQWSAEGSTVTFDLGTGVGLTGTVGYDARLARSASLTIGMNVSYGYIGDLRVLNDVVDRRFSFNAVALSLGFTWH